MTLMPNTNMKEGWSVTGNYYGMKPAQTGKNGKPQLIIDKTVPLYLQLISN
jgi:hypothetical protein